MKIKKLSYYQKRKEIRPWLFIWYDINKRCNNPKVDNYKYYGGKGIKNYLTIEDVKTLWFRDKAYSMKKPSIDRKKNNKSYSINNCEFIEMSKNVNKDRERQYYSSILKVNL